MVAATCRRRITAARPHHCGGSTRRCPHPSRVKTRRRRANARRMFELASPAYACGRSPRDVRRSPSVTAYGLPYRQRPVALPDPGVGVSASWRASTLPGAGIALYGAPAAGPAPRARLPLDEPLHSRNKSLILVGDHGTMDHRTPHSARDLDAVRGLVFGALFGLLVWIAGLLAVVGLMSVGW